MPAQRLDEEGTCLQLVTPALSRAGWRRSQLKQEVSTGRIRGDGSRGPGRADYVLYARDDRGMRPIAVLEVKSELHDAGVGAEQAAEYARALSVSAAFSTNGHDYVKVDVGSGAAGRRRPLAEFPAPEDLLVGDTPVEDGVDGRQRRWYQARPQDSEHLAPSGGHEQAITPSQSTRLPSRQRQKVSAARVNDSLVWQNGAIRETLVRRGWGPGALRDEHAGKLMGRSRSELRQFRLSTKKGGHSGEAALVLVVQNYSQLAELLDQAADLAQRDGTQHVLATNGTTYKWRNLLSGVESDYLPIWRFPRPGDLRADMPERGGRGMSGWGLWARLGSLWRSELFGRLFGL